MEPKYRVGQTIRVLPSTHRHRNPYRTKIVEVEVGENRVGYKCQSKKGFTEWFREHWLTEVNGMITYHVNNLLDGCLTDTPITSITPFVGSELYAQGSLFNMMFNQNFGSTTDPLNIV